MGRPESGILNSTTPEADRQPLGLYVHLPFCSSRCAYCDFHSFIFNDKLAAPLWQAINCHLRQLPEIYDLRTRVVDTIFLGGGTPSIWPGQALAELLDNIHKHLPISSNPEITLEANPDSLTSAKLKTLRQAGYNRLSLGVQSFNEKQLELLGRIHRPGQIFHALDWAQTAGFSNISLDIIYGLPWQSVEEARRDVEQALKFKAQHLSLYQLTLSPNTVLGSQYASGQFSLPDEDTLIAMEDMALQLCEQAGLMQYEVSNYARPGFHCCHNAATWQGGDYLAIGPGAHGHLSSQRWANIYHLPDYVAAWQANGSQAMQFVEHLSLDQQAGELFMLGLRTVRGVDLEQVSRVISRPAKAVYARAIQYAREQGWANISKGFLRPTRLGMRMADRAAMEFA